MYGYSWIQWLFLFFLYSFFGWCFESAYVSLKSKKLVNRGFIRGPFLPLYGSGALMMLLVSMPFQDSLVLTYLAGCVGATALEYVTGVAMESLFKVRYWDYSNQKFNFQGQICLSSTLAWGGLTILMTHVVHTPVARLMNALPYSVLEAVTMVTLVCFTADFALSFKAALDLRDVLIKMEQARQDLERMQRRLDVILALADEERENRREERENRREEREQRYSEFVENMREDIQQRREDIQQRREELAAGIESRFEKLRVALANPELHFEPRQEIQELREKFKLQMQRRETASYAQDAIRRGILRGNPTMVSKKFSEALEELKRSVADYGKKNEEDQ